MTYKNIYIYEKFFRMSIQLELEERSGLKCELCGNAGSLTVFEVKPTSNRGGDENVMVCGICNGQLENPDTLDANHWRCLNDSMWSDVEAVKVLAYRTLTKIKSEGWPQDLLDIIYLEEDTLAWAKAGLLAEEASLDIKHIDSNGVQLLSGDNVVLIKDLVVKGRGSFTAKRGTVVRGISLDHTNSDFIEGRVEGQQIVIITKYVKKN
jgi:protein PhnA